MIKFNLIVEGDGFRMSSWRKAETNGEIHRTLARLSLVDWSIISGAWSGEIAVYRRGKLLDHVRM